MQIKEKKQVNKSQYEFACYISKARWNSVWHQLDEVARLNPKNVLEIGPGPGVFKNMASLLEISVETLDLDPELKPNYVGSATALPFPDNAYDVVCAFQVLEHLPYEMSLHAFKEMARVSRRNVVISLPNAKKMWQYEFHVPKFGLYHLLVPNPWWNKLVHKFDGEHHWEINKTGYELDRVIRDLCRFCKLVKKYRVFENPYHMFFVFEK
jgi:ubiquinone/menaquinone biosynthesis C-methylase UbiE